MNQCKDRVKISSMSFVMENYENHSAKKYFVELKYIVFMTVISNTRSVNKVNTVLICWPWALNCCNYFKMSGRKCIFLFLRVTVVLLFLSVMCATEEGSKGTYCPCFSVSPSPEITFTAILNSHTSVPS